MTDAGYFADALSLDNSGASAVGEFVHRFNTLNEGTGYAVVVIGSVARGMAIAGSDLDLLVLTDVVSRLPEPKGPLHVHTSTWREFRRRLESGDDFAAWSVRFGIPIVGASLWNDLKQRSKSAWPDWRRKVPHATRRLILATELRKMGDEEAAKEELLYALSHIARALLLKENVFPLSRPELARQVKGLGYGRLAWLIQSFISDGSSSEIREAELYARKLLHHIDKNTYWEFSIASTKVRRIKSRGEDLSKTQRLKDEGS